MSAPKSLLGILIEPISSLLKAIVKHRLLMVKITLGLMVAVIILIVFSFFQKPDRPRLNRLNSVSIKEARHGEHVLYVPKIYGVAGRGQRSTELLTMYPGARILEASSSDMRRRGNRNEIIKTNIEYYNSKSQITFSEESEKRLGFYRASKDVGEEYGLVHLTQPLDHEKNMDDVWVERDQDGKIVLFINCTEKKVERSAFYCEQYYMLKPNLRVKTRFDGRHLPEWNTIKTNVDQLIDSLWAKETANSFCLSKASPVRCITGKY